MHSLKPIMIELRSLAVKILFHVAAENFTAQSFLSTNHNTSRDCFNYERAAESPECCKKNVQINKGLIAQCTNNRFYYIMHNIIAAAHAAHI